MLAVVLAALSRVLLRREDDDSIRYGSARSRIKMLTADHDVGGVRIVLSNQALVDLHRLMSACELNNEQRRTFSPAVAMG